MKNFFTVFIILLNTLYVGFSEPIEWIKCNNNFNNDPKSLISEIVLTLENYLIVKRLKNIYFSIDNGQYWMNYEDETGLIQNLSNFYCTENNKLFAKFDNYIYYSPDNGNNWSLFLMTERNINQFVVTQSKIVLLYNNYSMISVFDLTTRQLVNTFRLPDTRYLLKSDNDVYIITSYNCRVFKRDFQDLILLSQFRQKGFKIIAIDTLFIFNPQTTSDLRISSDYGTTWSEIKINDLELRNRINGNLAVDSRKNLYVFVRGEGLFKSSDIGKSWVKCFDLDTSCSMIYINPKDEVLLLTEKSVLFRSNDGGKNWLKIPLPKQQDVQSDIIDLVSNSKNEIYIVRKNKTFYHSSNRGDDWVYRGDYSIPYQIAISDSGDLYHLYINGNIAICYADTKNSWMISNNGMNHFPKCLYINNHENLLLLGSVYGGIYRSTNNGLLWKRVTSDTLIFTVDHIQLAPNDEYYAISQELGLLRSTNKGIKWVNVTNSDFYMDTIIDFKINSTGVFYVLKTSGELFFSSDKGLSWEKLLLPLDNIKVNSFIFTKSNDIFIGTDYYGVLRYKQENQKWISESSGLGTLFTKFIRADSGGYLYCSVPNEGLYRSKHPVEGPSSVPNSFNSNTNAIEIHPNPACDYIEIEFSSPRLKPWVGGSVDAIKIFNLLGECVLSVAQTFPSVDSGQTGMSDLLRIDVSGLPAGVYFVRVGDWGGRFLKI